VIFFRNQRVEPSADYTCDPLYRLVKATGREHLGQTGAALSPPQQVTSDDSFRTGLLQPGDGNAMGAYTETYGYDPVGNIATMSHQASSGGWTRRYSYAEPSQILATETGNRLTATSLPGDPANGPYRAACQHDAAGNMVQMPSLASLSWDEDDRLRSTARVAAVGGATPQTAYYCYDAGRQRVRKVTDGQAAAGQQPARKAERIYLDGIEIYREYAADGTTITLERETLHVAAGDAAVALAETRLAGNDRAPAQLVRYQHTNLLGSAVLELDDQSNILSYEEYFPYGSTSYEAVASQTDLPKRYRFTGKERDEENDLYYHGARYCAPWLGRWTSCDPDGMRDGVNLYRYASDNPVRMRDPDGRQGKDTDSGGQAGKPDAGQDDKDQKKVTAPPGSHKIWQQKLSEAIDQLSKDKAKLDYLRHLSPRDMREDLRLSLVSLYEGFVHREEVAALTYALLLQTIPERPAPEGEKRDERTLGIDVQIGGSGVGLGTSTAKGSVDLLQVTILDRNLEIIPIYFGHGWDIAAFKEWGIQAQVQAQPKDTGPGWEAKGTFGATIDLFNVSRDRWEVAISGSAGIDTTGTGSLTAGIGGKYTIRETGHVKFRLYGGAAIEKDYPSTPGAADPPAGWNVGGGLLIEINPLEKKKK
jgi:RHS repeat-associated protein